ncbi:SAM-dependent methyltransferase [Streptacidiphilus cavernicola]|uniref:SAM-dependent methyltransferase n=1 Tax=Streptacidiphilus cavernicola TaxID=3342716 RepID=A0ABV6W1I2_9ACTN
MTSEEIQGPTELDSWAPVRIDTSVAHPARMYDFYLGGKDNFPADREAAERIIAMGADVREGARTNRAFLGRAVRYLSAQGVSQFLDIGTGIPSAGNTHEIAQSVDPAARVVYVDNDPIVLAHARALMGGHGKGATTVVQADLRDPAAILADPRVRAALDFDRPIALMLVAVLHFITEEDGPDRIIKTLGDALPGGSYLVVSHGTGDGVAERKRPGLDEAVDVYRNRSTAALSLRGKARIAEFFADFPLVEPGLVPGQDWRPDAETPPATMVTVYGGVGRKP